MPLVPERNLLLPGAPLSGQLPGGGALKATATAAHKSSSVTTGSGSLFVSAVAAHKSTTLQAGGGVLDVIGQTGTRTGSTKLMGGGLILVPSTSQRLSSIKLTGGGTPRVADAQTVTESSIVTGGGALLVADATARIEVTRVSGGGTLRVISIVSHTESALTSGGGQLGVSAVVAHTEPVLVTGGGEPLASAAISHTEPVLLAGGGSLRATDSRVDTDTTTVTGGGSLLVSAVAVHIESVLLGGGGAPSVSAVAIHIESVFLSGGGVLLGSNSHIAGTGTMLMGGGQPLVAVAKRSGGTCDYREVVLQDSPVAYYRLDEPSGVVAVDQQGAHNGAYTGTPTYSYPGATFDGDAAVALPVSSEMDVPFSPALNTPNFSVEVWMKPVTSGIAAGAIISLAVNQSATVNGWSLQFRQVSGTVGAFGVWEFNVGKIGTPTTLAAPAFASQSGYSHIVGTFDGTTARLFINGSLVTAVATSFVPNPSALLHLIGQTLSGQPFPFDELAVYNFALSSQQVTAHFDSAICSSGILGGGGLAINVPQRHVLTTATLFGGGCTKDEYAPNFQSSVQLSGGGELKTCRSVENLYADPYTDLYGVTTCPSKQLDGFGALGGGGNLLVAFTAFEGTTCRVTGGGELITCGLPPEGSPEANALIATLALVLGLTIEVVTALLFPEEGPPAFIPCPLKIAAFTGRETGGGQLRVSAVAHHPSATTLCGGGQPLVLVPEHHESFCRLSGGGVVTARAIHHSGAVTKVHGGGWISAIPVPTNDRRCLTFGGSNRSCATDDGANRACVSEPGTFRRCST